MDNTEERPEIRDTLYRATILAGHILERFGKPIFENQEDFLWVMEQLGEFATEMHTIGGIFAINELKKRGVVSE